MPRKSEGAGSKLPPFFDRQKFLHQTRNMTQMEVAEVIGKSQSYISYIKSGKVEILTNDVTPLINQGFGRAEDYINEKYL
ncbi:gp35 [Listeria phage P35]|uniref:Cro/C1-type helix-turn-helix domain-containing protein n=1 Tax=Listeria phage LP-083-1 TaxID=1458854 RepID=A0A059T878_9CAUD|nr:gp35 [Listeria phage P35]AAY53220.1 gp35 [Listeria phage P35]AHL19000.1 Cro/C1-type helix-turn-helix domain-containing protein [Listeria phage LP-083-1]